MEGLGRAIGVLLLPLIPKAQEVKPFFPYTNPQYSLHTASACGSKTPSTNPYDSLPGGKKGEGLLCSQGMMKPLWSLLYPERNLYQPVFGATGVQKAVLLKMK